MPLSPRLILPGLALVMSACGNAQDATTQTPEEPANMNATSITPVHDLEFTSLENAPMPLSEYAGQPILLVNTASKCGLTPQYEGLQQLHETYADKGLVVLGVPSDNFGGQEYGEDAKIKEFCEIRYGVTFPLTTKSNVVGETRHEVFARTEAALGEAAVPQWNFHKVLIDASGQPVQAFTSRTEPTDPAVISAIEALLPTRSMPRTAPVARVVGIDISMASRAPSARV